MGQASKVVVTGDDSQVDLPANQRSGLDDAEQLLQNVSDIAIVRLEQKDIVRHPLVHKIVKAYEQRDRGRPGAGRR
jgi:phosphate starvation-inducible PhoH-like protein